MPSPLQPRKAFQSEQLQELVESIREHGIIQPLIVRKVEGKCELIAGERRWRAASQLGLKEAPVIVRQASDRDVLELALIENLQREDLNPIEEAHAYRRLAEEFSLRQEDIAQRVGKSRSVVANSLRLLDLHSQVQAYLAQGRLSVGHAKVLLALQNQDEQLVAAELTIRQAATVRMTERHRRCPVSSSRPRQERETRCAGQAKETRQLFRMPSVIWRVACATGLPPMSRFTTAKKRDGSKSNTTATTISTVFFCYWEFRFSEKKCRVVGGRNGKKTSSVEEKARRLVGTGRGLVFQSFFHRLQLQAERHCHTR